MLNGVDGDVYKRQLEMPVFPKERFVEAVTKVVEANADYVPVRKNRSPPRGLSVQKSPKGAAGLAQQVRKNRSPPRGLSV